MITSFRRKYDNERVQHRYVIRIMSLYSPARWDRNYDITVVSRFFKRKKNNNNNNRGHIVQVEASVAVARFSRDRRH